MLWARSIHLEDRKRRLAYLVERAAIGRLLHSETFEEGDKLLRSLPLRPIDVVGQGEVPGVAGGQS